MHEQTEWNSQCNKSGSDCVREWCTALDPVFCRRDVVGAVGGGMAGTVNGLER